MSTYGWLLVVGSLAMLVAGIRYVGQFELATEDEEHFAGIDTSAALELIYRLTIPAQAAAARMVRSQAKRMVAYHLVSIALAIVLMKTTGLAPYGVIVMAVSLISLPILAGGHLRASRFIERMQRARRLERASQRVHDRIVALLAPTLRRANVNVPFTIWIATESAEVLPSIVVRNGVAELVLPLGFLPITLEHPQLASAMLAHEVGHILQEDSDLLFFAEYGGRLAQLGVVIVLLAQIAWGISLGLLFGLIPALVLGTSVLFHIRLTWRVRVCSEHMADVAAVVYGDAFAFREALRLYVQPGGSWNHATRADRLKRVSRYIQDIWGR